MIFFVSKPSYQERYCRIFPVVSAESPLLVDKLHYLDIIHYLITLFKTNILKINHCSKYCIIISRWTGMTGVNVALFIACLMTFKRLASPVNKGMVGVVLQIQYLFCPFRRSWYIHKANLFLICMRVFDLQFWKII